MKKIGNSFELHATDLVGYLQCRHLTVLDRAVAEGALPKPRIWDPFLQILSERGSAHEQSYVNHLIASGFDVVRIEGRDVSDAVVAETLATMRQGTAVIVQAALLHEGWGGRADILLRVERPSALGAWSYEPVDTKLARETKAATVLQLCVYADLLAGTQGLAPEYMHVVAPWTDFQPQRYRFTDYAAYFRKVKRALMSTVAAPMSDDSYPIRIEHCDICRWQDACEKRRRDDDHLCLVAGITKMQINELTARGISTQRSLAGMPLPLEWKPARGSAESYSRIREQARIVVEARDAGVSKFELLPLEAGLGFMRLPEPSAGDIFFDIEGDPFVGEHGLEYLFGYIFKDDWGVLVYQGDWALMRAEEKQAFQRFVDFVIERWRRFPDLHIYHYAPYEPGALKRLMGRYATREEEVDRMLRAGLFVDLYQVVRQGLRASVESYSIKRLEPFYAFERSTPLVDANAALANLQASIELSGSTLVSDEARATVRSYNEDDCRSALKLHEWLETLRASLIANGKGVPRPQPGDGTPNVNITEWMIKIQFLMERLTSNVPDAPEDRNQQQKALWTLANILDWHRREEKAVWWEYFRLAGLSAEDLLGERAGLSGLEFVETVGGTARAPVHRYRFPLQETELRGGEKLRNRWLLPGRHPHR
jgi:predicted RecB family nuclease